MLLFETRHLVKSFKQRRVVNDVNLYVNQGEVVGLLGPNGAGKTTTFSIIVGLLRPEKGHIIFKKKNISLLPMYKRARIGISYLPQMSSIFRKLTVEENIRIVLQYMGILGGCSLCDLILKREKKSKDKTRRTPRQKI